MSQIDIKVVISIKYDWNTIAWAKFMNLGCQNPYQQQNLKILLIFRDSKHSPFRTKLLYFTETYF